MPDTPIDERLVHYAVDAGDRTSALCYNTGLTLHLNRRRVRSPATTTKRESEVTCGKCRTILRVSPASGSDA